MARPKIRVRFPLRGQQGPSGPPISCICGHKKFKKSGCKGKARTFMCKKYDNKYYRYPYPVERLRQDGEILDRLAEGMGFDRISTIFRDKNVADITEETVKNSVYDAKHLFTFTDDVLCSLHYGRAWSLDETLIKTKLMAEEEPGLRKRLEYEKRKYMPYDLWLTGVLDMETRVLISYIITDYRPDIHDMHLLYMRAIAVAGIPHTIITDGNRSYRRAVLNLNKQLEKENGVI